MSAAVAEKRPVAGKVLRIERVTLIEFDEKTERERIERNFKGKDKKLLTQLVDAFVALKWDDATELLRGMTRDQLEYVHMVIYDVLRARADRLKVQADTEGKRVSFSALNKMSGTCTRETLDYPKFRVGETVL